MLYHDKRAHLFPVHRAQTAVVGSAARYIDARKVQLFKMLRYQLLLVSTLYERHSLPAGIAVGVLLVFMARCTNGAMADNISDTTQLRQQSELHKFVTYPVITGPFYC